MMTPPSASLLRLFSPVWNTSKAAWTSPACVQRRAGFATTPAALARSKKGAKGAGAGRSISKTTLIRYYLGHPRLPRPLRFSRNRWLRHWTIHRAWQLFQSKQRMERELTLEKQYNSMANACEQLRLIDSTGLTSEDRVRIGAQDVEPKEVGRLYRIAMMKGGSWDGAPIEYARIQTDTPSKDGWNHTWTR